jgi:hypothetical protein
LSPSGRDEDSARTAPAVSQVRLTPSTAALSRGFDADSMLRRSLAPLHSATSRSTVRLAAFVVLYRPVQYTFGRLLAP